MEHVSLWLNHPVDLGMLVFWFFFSFFTSLRFVSPSFLSSSHQADSFFFFLTSNLLMICYFPVFSSATLLGGCRSLMHHRRYLLGAFSFLYSRFPLIDLCGL